MIQQTSGYVVVQGADTLLKVLDRLESIRQTSNITWQQVVVANEREWWVLWSSRYSTPAAVEQILIGEGARAHT